MKKYLFLCIALSVFACKETSKENQKASITAGVNESFAALLDSYYEESLQLYPMNATAQGDSRYNDLLPNPLIPVSYTHLTLPTKA